MLTIKQMRTASGLSQVAFGELLEIPRRSVQNWEAAETGGKDGHACPDYVKKLIYYKLTHENIIEPTPE